MHHFVQQTSLTRRDERSLAPQIGPAGNAINAGPGVTSLMQLQSMLNGGPAVVAQLQLARDLSRRAVSPSPIQRINRTGLPDQLKAGAESLSGLSLDDVQVHYNSSEPATLQAAAFAQGTDIHVGPGQEQHLPHEAWHVVQQKQGRVRPTLQAKGVAINDDSELEAEADRMGAQAQREELPLQMWSMTGSRSPGATLHAAPLQLKWIDSGGGLFRWSSLRGGLRWYYASRENKMTFDVVDEKPSANWLKTYGQLAGQWFTYQQWIDLGIWGPEPAPEIEDRQAEEEFQILVQAGQSTYAKSIVAAQKSERFGLEQAEATRRTKAFDTDYETNIKDDDVTSVLKNRSATDVREGFGKYANRFNLGVASGSIDADANYQSASVPENISNSEVLFQQMQRVKKESGIKGSVPITLLSRKHIAGKARAALAKICKVLGVENTEQAEFLNGTDGFFALLSLANAKSAMWLVADHGDELGIRDIRSITILAGRSLQINFEPSRVNEGKQKD
ncbi:DUF4157 domain-containing protein [Tardiphaga sp.]|uniref:eCIS core domain-containing protein n=1 Tax=Tardiphaga sp. TaxID=1926292 RepID=UPI0025DF9D85|nr:DUF4157 domain-containing protein [Tardiphaga sp.]